MAELQTALGTLTGGTASVNTTNGNITVTASSLDRHDPGRRHRDRDAISASTPRTALPSNQQVLGIDVTTFLNQTIGGGAITCYDVSGSPVNMQLRWAKVDSASLGTGHTDTWNLFYQVNSQRDRHAGRLAECRRQLHASTRTAR